MKFLKKIFSFITKFRFVFLGLWGVLLIGSVVMIIITDNINYDSTQYLPANTRTTESLQVMKDEFGLVGQASLMIENVTIEEAVTIKQGVKAVDGVSEVIWLDTFIEPFADMSQVAEIASIIEENMQNISIAGIDQFYKNKSALFQIMFDEDDYHQKTYNAIERVRDKVGNSLLPGQTFAMGGSAVSAYYVRVLTTSEVFKITLYVLPIF